MLIQILLSFWILFVLWKVWERKRHEALPMWEAVSWTLFWMLAAAVVWVPESTSRIARWVGIGRGVDVVVYTSVAVLFYMVFRIIVRIEKIERDITVIVRKHALQDAKKQEEYGSSHKSNPPAP